MELFSINIATYVGLTCTRVTRHTFLQTNNPLAHEFTTAPQIIEAVVSTPSTPVHSSSGSLDVFVASAGTGGTISGVAKGIKKAHNPDCVVVGVDPVCCLFPYPLI